MILALQSLLPVTRALAASARRKRADRRGGECRSCGATVHPALDECLPCLGERHW